MNPTQRLLLALGIVLIDLLTIGVPLCAFGLAYVIVARPVWFRNWITQLYEAP